MKMEAPLFSIIRDQCIKCYACVRICPVKAIRVDAGTDFPEIIPDRCIGCGSCYRACSPAAIRYRSSVESVKELLHRPEKKAAICDPSISGEFNDITDYRKFVEMIRQLGFDYVSEVSFGVDLVAERYRELFEDFHGKYYIMANCPAVVSYIEKYHPDLINNLAPIVSPMIATAKAIRRKYGNEVSVVYIGPCIAAKDEALRYTDDGKVDGVLTFPELRALFQEYNVRESQLEFSEFDPPLGYTGSLYPLSNGILQAAGLNEDLLSGSIITTEGRNNMLDAVREFDTRIDLIRRHFNIFYNEGCLMGPGMSAGGEKFLRRTLVTDYANKRLKTFDQPAWERERSFMTDLDLSRGFVADDQRLPVPTDAEIREILSLIGKETQMENEIGCESCGYTSCRDFAVAIAQGLATTDMCHIYSSRNRQDYIHSLRAANEKLARTQAALRESEEKAKHEQEAEREATETMSAMLNRLVSGVVILDEELKVVQSNRAFVRILGEEAALVDEVIPGLIGADLKTLIPPHFFKMFSYVLGADEDIQNKDVQLGEIALSVSIFTIRKNKFIGAILRDIYAPEIRKDQIIGRLTEAIDQNFEMVQKIAYLLGEGAATTEKMLRAVIETHQSPPKK